MRAAFITLVISSLWGFASFTPLVTAHNVHLLWVFTSVLMGASFGALLRSIWRTPLHYGGAASWGICEWFIVDSGLT